MTLHILNRRIDEVDLLIGSDDEVLLIENGVYDLSAYQQSLNGAVYALRADLEARGLLMAQPSAFVIDYLTFVDLCAKHDKVVSW